MRGFGIFVMSSVSLWASSSSWQGASGGTWNTPGNWSSVIPGTAGHEAVTALFPASPGGTVSLDIDVTLSEMDFSANYTIVPASTQQITANTGGLTLATGAFAPHISATMRIPNVTLTQGGSGGLVLGEIKNHDTTSGAVLLTILADLLTADSISCTASSGATGNVTLSLGGTVNCTGDLTCTSAKTAQASGDTAILNLTNATTTCGGDILVQSTVVTGRATLNMTGTTLGSLGSLSCSIPSAISGVQLPTIATMNITNSTINMAGQDIVCGGAACNQETVVISNSSITSHSLNVSGSTDTDNFFAVTVTDSTLKIPQISCDAPSGSFANNCSLTVSGSNVTAASLYSGPQKLDN